MTGFFKGQPAGAIDGGRRGLLGYLKHTVNRAALNTTVPQLEDICLYQVPNIFLKAFQNKCTCRDGKRSPQDARIWSRDIKHRRPTVFISQLPIHHCSPASSDPKVIEVQLTVVFFFSSSLSACATLWSGRTRLSLWCSAVHHHAYVHTLI